MNKKSALLGLSVFLSPAVLAASALGQDAQTSNFDQGIDIRKTFQGLESAAREVSAQPSAVGTGAGLKYSVQPRAVRIQFADGLFETLSLKTPGGSVGAPNSSDGGVSIEILVSGESAGKIDALADTIKNEFDALLADAARTGNKNPEISINGVKEGPMHTYQCSRRRINDQVTVASGACLESIVVSLPAPASKTVVIINDEEVGARAPGAITADILKAKVKKASFDADKLQAIALFVKSNAERGAVISLADAVEVAARVTFHQEEALDAFRGKVYPEDAAAGHKDFKAALGKFTGDTEKLKLARLVKTSYADSERFLTVQDVLEMLRHVTFEKIEFVREFSGRVSDPQNAARIREATMMPSWEKDEAQEILSR